MDQRNAEQDAPFEQAPQNTPADGGEAGARPPYNEYRPYTVPQQPAPGQAQQPQQPQAGFSHPLYGAGAQQAPDGFAQQPYGAAQQSYGAAQGAPQQPFAQPPHYGQQPYAGQPQQPYAAQPGQPYGAPQQPYGQQPYAPPSYSQPVATKDHVAAGLLAIFLGVFGVHKFYLGYNTAGFVMLAVTILGSLLTFGLAATVMWIISIIEGVIYLVKSQSEFDAVYVARKKEWF